MRSFVGEPGVGVMEELVKVVHLGMSGLEVIECLANVVEVGIDVRVGEVDDECISDVLEAGEASGEGGKAELQEDADPDVPEAMAPAPVLAEDGLQSGGGRDALLDLFLDLVEVDGAYDGLPEVDGGWEGEKLAAGGDRGVDHHASC